MVKARKSAADIRSTGFLPKFSDMGARSMPPRAYGNTKADKTSCIRQFVELDCNDLIVQHTFRSTEEVILNSSATSGSAGAIIDDANGSRNANSPMMTAARSLIREGHCCGSIDEDFWCSEFASTFSSSSGILLEPKVDEGRIGKQAAQY